MHKENFKYQITYVLFVMFFLNGTIFYRQSFMAILTILFIILPVISIWLTRVLAKRIGITVKAKTFSVTTGNPVSFSIALTNPTFFSFLNCEGDFVFSNLFYENGEPSHNTVALSAPARKTNECFLSFPTRYSGICSFTFSNFRITDPLHLYTVKLNTEAGFQIPVLPEISDDIYPLFPAAFADNEDDELLSSKGGVSQEIKDIREYRPGDRLSLIHWKMSAKKDELLFKELQESASRVIVLLPEIAEAQLEDTVSTFWSYMHFLIKEHEVFRVLIYDNSDNEMCDRLVQNDEDALDALLKMYYCPVYKGSEYGLSHYKSLYGEDQTAIHIVGKTIQVM